MGFPGGSDGKESACNAGDRGSIPGLGRSPGEGNGYPPTPVFLPGESQGRRSLAGYGPGSQRFKHNCVTNTHTTKLSLPGGLSGKESACSAKAIGWLSGWGGSLEGTATHSSVLAWRIPWTEEPGGLRSMGWKRVTHY